MAQSLQDKIDIDVEKEKSDEIGPGRSFLGTGMRMLRDIKRKEDRENAKYHGYQKRAIPFHTGVVPFHAGAADFP
jgi:hypothetical protein